jgi:chemotaxis signal transduction protein
MPVMDAARFIDNGRTRLQPRHKFIIVNGETSSAAVLVERVDDLVEVPKSAVDRRDFHSGTGKGIHGIFVHNDQMVIILDLESCLTDSFHAEVAQQEPVLLKLKKEGLVI